MRSSSTTLDFLLPKFKSSTPLRSTTEGLTKAEQRWGTPARLQAALRQLDIRSASYLGLVESMKSQEAFMTVLKEFGRQAWQEYTGYAVEILQPMPGDVQYQAIQQRVGHWIGEGYKRLIPASSAPSSSGDPSPVDVATGEQGTRRERLATPRCDARSDKGSCSVHGEQAGQTPADIGVITIREDEYNAVLNRLPQKEVITRTNRSYVIGTVSGRNGESYRVALLRTLDQEPNAGQDSARDIIEDLDPRWLALVGIGGACPDTEFTLGDVVVATRLHDFTVSALIEGSSPQFANQGGPMKKEVQDLVALLPALNPSLGEWDAEEDIWACRAPRLIWVMKVLRPERLEAGSPQGPQRALRPNRYSQSSDRHCPPHSIERSPYQRHGNDKGLAPNSTGFGSG